MLRLFRASDCHYRLQCLSRLPMLELSTRSEVFRFRLGCWVNISKIKHILCFSCFWWFKIFLIIKYIHNNTSNNFNISGIHPFKISMVYIITFATSYITLSSFRTIRARDASGRHRWRMYQDSRAPPPLHIGWGTVHHFSCRTVTKNAPNIIFVIWPFELHTPIVYYHAIYTKMTKRDLIIS